MPVHYTKSRVGTIAQRARESRFLLEKMHVEEAAICRIFCGCMRTHRAHDCAKAWDGVLEIREVLV